MPEVSFSEPSNKKRAIEPVEFLESEKVGPEPGIGLSLSGGGYRAMLFHVGSLWRLYETGLLGRLDRISSVSGGSITGAVLGLAWNQIQPNAAPHRARFEKNLVQPIHALADETIDSSGIIGGIFLPGTISEKIQDSYRKHLYGDATLQELPDKPRFVINASNVRSGALWRFSKPYMANYRVGMVKNPSVSLAQAVGASSAFPPVLSLMVMKLDPLSFTANGGQDLQRKPFTSRVVLSDGSAIEYLLSTKCFDFHSIFRRYYAQSRHYQSC
jgi:NTE family protein